MTSGADRHFALDPIRDAFDKLVANGAFFAVIGLILVLVTYTPAGMLSLYDQFGVQAGFVPALVVGASVPFQILIGMGLLQMALRLHDKKSISIYHLVAPYQYFFNYVVGSIIYGLIVLAGVALLIVPGVYWAIRLQFYGYAIIDRNAGPIESLRISYRATRGLTWVILKTQIILIVFGIASSVFLFIGPIVVGIMSALALGYIYRRWLYRTDISAD